MRVAVAVIVEVRELLREDPSQLNALLEEIHDEDLADLLRLLDDQEAMLVLEQLDAQAAADVFERLDEHDQAELVARFGTRRLAPIVSEMAPDDRTDFIDALPEQVGDRLLDALEPGAAAEVVQLREWADDTAGGLMTTDLIRLSPDLTVNDTIDRIRKHGQDAETIYYIYGVEEDGRLTGVTSLRELIMADGDAQLRSIMSEHVYSVAPQTDQEEVARMLRKYDFTAMPVVDDQQQLLGLITVDDVMDVVAEEQDEDVQRLGAVAPIADDYFNTTFWTFIQKRAPWLAILFFGQFVTVAVMRHYDPVIQTLTQLTYFLPMLISTGGNSGAQSAALIIRGLATGDVTLKHWWRVLLRELGQGLVLGVMLALVGMMRVLMLGGSNEMAQTIGMTVVCIVLLGCTIGAMLPLLLQRLGLDPATSSTPFIATLVDVVGIVLYFTLAQYLMRQALAGAGLM